MEGFQRNSTHRSVHYTSQQRRSSLSFPLVSKSAQALVQTNMNRALSRLRHSDRIYTVKCIVKRPETLLIHHRLSSSGFWAVSAGPRGPLSRSSSERLRRGRACERSSALAAFARMLMSPCVGSAESGQQCVLTHSGCLVAAGCSSSHFLKWAAGQSSHWGFICIKMHPKQRGGKTHGFKVKKKKKMISVPLQNFTNGT